jgi:hypothetical protein
MPGKRRRKKFSYTVLLESAGGTGRGGVRARQEDENRKQDKEERHKESNDGCRGIRGRIDEILRGEAWDKYCTVKWKKSSVKRQEDRNWREMRLKTG